MKPKPPTKPTPPSAPLAERGAFEAPADVTLAAALRTQMPGRSWAEVRRLCETGKVTVGGRTTLDPALRLRGGEPVAWKLSSPDARRASRPSVQIVHEDPHLIIVDKPEGVTSVPYERKDTGTALDLIREVWKLKGRSSTTSPLYVVHRLDKDTSGLICFAKTKLGERGLHLVFKQHEADRHYLAVAEGDVRPGRIASNIVPDRGDGIRGSSRFPDQGQHAVTHVTIEETLRGTTLCRVQLETGRTHQIRIHLSESGHPLVGETVYIRDLLRAGRTPMASTRLLLHAASLGFKHPITGARIEYKSGLPPDYLEMLARLRG